MPCNHNKDPTLPHWHSILNTCYLFFVGSLPQDGQKVSQLEILQRMKFPHCCITKSDMRAHCNDHCNKGKVIVPSPFTQIFTTAILSTSMFYKKTTKSRLDFAMEPKGITHPECAEVGRGPSPCSHVNPSSSSHVYLERCPHIWRRKMREAVKGAHQEKEPN